MPPLPPFCDRHRFPRRTLHKRFTLKAAVNPPRRIHPGVRDREQEMQRFSFAVDVVAILVLSAASAQAQTTPQRLELDRKGQTIVLEPYADNILRVTLSLNRAPALAAPGYGIIGTPSASGWTSAETPAANVFQSSRIVAT